MSKFGELGSGKFFIRQEDLSKSKYGSAYEVALKVLYLKLSAELDPSKPNAIRILEGWSGLGDKASTEYVKISDEDFIVEARPLDPHGISFIW